MRSSWPPIPIMQPPPNKLNLTAVATLSGPKQPDVEMATVESTVPKVSAETSVLLLRWIHIRHAAEP